MLKYVIFLVAIIVLFCDGKHSKLKIGPKHKTFARNGRREAAAANNLLKYMDPTIDPCDDFYQFACGTFIRNTRIPEDKAVVGPMYDLLDGITERLRRVIEKPPIRTETKPFILLRKLYKTCMDKEQREQHGATRINTILKFLGGWPVLQGNKFNEERFDWTLIMYKLRELGYPTNSLITVDVKEDEKKSTRRVITLGQASLGMKKEFFDLAADDEFVRAYYESMVKAAKALGARGALIANDMKKWFEFEKALANISVPLERLRNSTAIYNPMTLAQLQKIHPSVQWRTYITNILDIPGIKVADNEVIIVETPQYIKDLENLLNRTSKRVLANYIIWRVVKFSVPYLSESLSNVMLRLEMVQEGTLEKQRRSTQCTEEIFDKMPLAMGSWYVRKVFNRSLNMPVREIVSKLLPAFGDLLHKQLWMDESTKANALRKFYSKAIYVGYADEILDDRQLEKYYSDLNSDNYFLQMLNVSKFNEDKKFGLLRQSVNKGEWSTRESPANLNAYYSTTENAIHILAAVIQAPFFSNDRPEYMNYGAIGTTIGHEITHGFDQNGAQSDENGNLVNWWTNSTKQAYQEKVQCIVEQYANFTVPELGNMHLKGTTTANENIADHGGLLAAYEAYILWAKYKDIELYLPVLNYTLNQLFWISYANLLCGKFRPSFLKGMLLANAHSPGEFRVLGPLRNLKEFSKDFNCPLGSKMNPTHKCQLW